MTRGRKKDLSIPPSRSLAQQRDYRARKAQYVAELEDRCRRAEEENDRLRREVEQLRSQVENNNVGVQLPTALFSSGTVQAATQLMQQIASSSASLASSMNRFQDLVSSNPTSSWSPPSTTGNECGSAPAGCNSVPAYILHTSRPLDPSQIATSSSCGTTIQATASSSTEGQLTRNTRDSHEWSLGPDSSESECCGGLLDCTGLIEEGEDTDEQPQPGPSTIQRLSEMRTTSRELDTA
ncbi:hypothetical protein JAAARDRAFT_35370 [Jaapia argillacea MUCL 33604]|uniref:BZIP domain-containing protein n=1 Tax=Jaapia argillacea MUCL 33604 TaxID=933084 RepID=A0A067PUZ3_9AGAM|nr:hypothetical protein JAAARDRAFT_35370 [Jaapia argillacea MUCL 33604]